MICNQCGIRLSVYNNSDYIDKICWSCGYYESNSPAFLQNPELFKNLVRHNPVHFMRKYGTYQPIVNTENNSREDNRI